MKIIDHAGSVNACEGTSEPTDWSGGVVNKVLAWIMEWLTGRRQKVVLNGKKSEWGVDGSVPDL